MLSENLARCANIVGSKKAELNKLNSIAENKRESNANGKTNKTPEINRKCRGKLWHLMEIGAISGKLSENN